MEKAINIALKISRLIVGGLFIVSGLIKTNDALGFSYKLVEYFSDGVLGMEFLIPFALPIAMFVCIVEVILGVALIFGLKGRLVSWSILLMMLFFTWLTWYTSSCLEEMQIATEQGQEFLKNCVSDCGCFGDAVKLTPKQSFHKDLFLMVFTLILFIFQKRIKINALSEDRIMTIAALLMIFGFSVFYIKWWFPVYFSILVLVGIAILKRLWKHKHIDWIIAGIVAVVTTVYTIYCYWHLPVKDFRPYKEGANITNGMSIPDGAPEAVYKITWIIEENGKQVTYETEKDYPKTDGKYISHKMVEVSPGYEPPIHDFTIEKGDQNLTEQMLNEEKIIFVVAYNLGKSDANGWNNIKEQTDKALSQGYKVIGLSASTKPEDINKVKKQFGLNFDFYFCDETALKTVIRSNPGLVKLNKGTILQKLHYNDANNLEL